jgi:hypothetical protein
MNSMKNNQRRGAKEGVGQHELVAVVAGQYSSNIHMYIYSIELATHLCEFGQPLSVGHAGLLRLLQTALAASGMASQGVFILLLQLLQLVQRLPDAMAAMGTHKNKDETRFRWDGPG